MAPKIGRVGFLSRPSEVLLLLLAFLAANLLLLTRMELRLAASTGHQDTRVQGCAVEEEVRLHLIKE